MNNSTIGHPLLSLLCILCCLGISACTYGPPRTEARIENVRARPDSHQIAIAVSYRRLQDATGINAFPNGGVPRLLEEQARIYWCDVDSLKVLNQTAISPPRDVAIGWQPWVLGWADGALFFKISGQAGTRLEDIQNSKRIFYRLDSNNAVTRIAPLPASIGFQSNTGPVTTQLSVRNSHNSHSIAIKTEGQTDWQVRFVIDPQSGELKPSHEGS